MRAVRVVLIADQPTLLRRVGGDADKALAFVADLFAGLTASGAAVMLMDRDVRTGGDDRLRLARLRRYREVATAVGSLLVVNQRVDLAAACGADGVQLPERGLGPAAVRRAFPQLLVGRSCHDREGVLAAVGAGADWVTVAPVHAPLSKAGRGSALGRQGYLDATSRCGVASFALGGITAQNASGLGPVATIGAVVLSPAPQDALNALLAATRAI